MPECGTVGIVVCDEKGIRFDCCFECGWWCLWNVRCCGQLLEFVQQPAERHHPVRHQCFDKTKVRGEDDVVEAACVRGLCCGCVSFLGGEM